MKRIWLCMIMGFCAALPSFAQLRMNGWGRAVWLPVYIDQSGETKTIVQSSYGDLPDLEFTFSASSENIGADIGVIVGQGTFNQIGNAKIWWKPNRYFKLHIGLGRVATLRGKVESSTGAYSYARGRITGLTLPTGKNEPIVLIDDGDGIFSRFNLSKMGAIMEITPLPGLFIGAAVAPNSLVNNGLLAKDVYRGLHVAAGYEINNIGHIRMGYIGGGRNGSPAGNAGENWDFSWDQRIEAAFALTAVENLLIDFGLKYSLEDHPGTLDQPGFSLENPLYAAVGVMFTGIPNLRLGFAVDGHFAGTAEAGKDGAAITSAPQIAFNIYPTYDLGIFAIGGDLTYGIQFGDMEGVNDKQNLGFGLHIQKQYGHGNVRGGIALNPPLENGEKWGFAVPLWITYSF
ncbi:MAG: hypothetical protein LBH57_04955 [Treponema sp.]|nr:hypothetical protein [Treponema sp.]